MLSCVWTMQVCKLILNFGLGTVCFENFILKCLQLSSQVKTHDINSSNFEPQIAYKLFVALFTASMNHTAFKLFHLI